MKIRIMTALAAVVMMMGLLTACEAGAREDPEPNMSSPTSAAPNDGVDSHTFEGNGGEDYIETETVELAGEYTVEWEIAGNEASDGTDVIFDAILKSGDTMSHTIVTENVSNGSGTINISISEPGEYCVRLYARPEASWQISLTRNQ